MTAFVWGAATDVGRVRSGNEDFLLADDGLFIVADGMGGHKAGEVASHLAVQHVRDMILDGAAPAPPGANGAKADDVAVDDEQLDPAARAGRPDRPEQRSTADGRLLPTTDDLVEAVQQANATLVEKAHDDPELKGMGTTLCALALVGDVAEGRDLLGVVNVGDSRLYLLKTGELEQITEDHSLVATLERQGRLTAAEAAVHPQRNIVTRALGIDSKVMVDSWEILPFVGDRYLLCSDGLFNEVDDAVIAATLRKLADPSEAARELVRLANEGGGRDNITCVVVDIVDDTGRDPGLTPEQGRIASKVDGKARVLAAAHANSDDLIRRDDEHPPTKDKRGWFTWRLALFLLLFLVIVGAAFGSIVFAGTSTYYVGFDGDVVTIFQGKPGGVLWIDPEPVERTSLTRQQVPAVVRDELEKGFERSDLEAARRYVANLQEQAGPSTGPTPTGPATSPAPAAPSTTAPGATTSTAEPAPDAPDPDL